MVSQSHLTLNPAEATRMLTVHADKQLTGSLTIYMDMNYKEHLYTRADNIITLSTAGPSGSNVPEDHALIEDLAYDFC